jgi:ring-1,2-phenylacetyl-CoA epoxidase subunit PaaC
VSTHPHTEVGEHDPGNAYRSLAESVAHDDPRWAFGTGVEAEWGMHSQAEITSPVPDGVDAADLAQYCLMLGDDALICSQRLAEWVSNAPELEEDVALANIALDLLGQARILLARAGHAEGSAASVAGSEGSAAASIAGSAAAPMAGSAAAPMAGPAGWDEDALAYLRAESEFRNVALAELPDHLDFAAAVGRLLLFSTWRLALLQRLLGSRDPVLAALAGKGVKELTYHRDYAARWTLRLGDGTAESKRRMQSALDTVWPYLEELFRASDVERRLAAVGVAVDPASTRAEVDAVLDEVITRATLTRPTKPGIGTIGGRSGRQGLHTEHLGHLLAEMQSLARQHPGARW